MDIRRWLISPKNTNSKTNNNASEDKDEQSKQVSSSPKKSSKVRRKRRVIESDSDEEPIPKEKNGGSKVSESPKKQSPDSVKKPDEKKKPVSVSAFFGSAPVVRNDKAKKPKSETNDSDSIHEDPSFDATIKQLKSKLSKETSANDVTEEKKKLSPKEKVEKGKPKSRKKSANPMEFEAAPQQKKTVVVEDPKPPPKKHKGNAGYASYLGREGPKSLGSKEIPEGEEGCLAGLTFVITGVLETIERDDAKTLVEKYGGKVMTTLTKNTKYVVIGRDAGSSKLDKAEKFKTKQLDEDGLFDLISTMPGKKGTRKPAAKKSEPLDFEMDDMDEEFEKEMAGVVDSLDDSMVESESVSDTKKSDDIFTKEAKSVNAPGKVEISPGKSRTPPKPVTPTRVVKLEKNTPEKVESAPEKSRTPPKPVTPTRVIKTEKTLEKLEESPEKSTKKPSTVSSGKIVNTNMWVDKYKPSSMKNIIGQQGDKSNAKKLLNWLMNWKKNRMLGKKPVFAGRFNAQDDGSGYKAALLSGPPGVGKTTTAQLVCKEAGYDFFELNASDSRSKKYLQQSVSQVLGNQTLGDCFSGSSSGKVTSKHAIVMDEVDGMAGNEDRGGMKELIDFIKASKVPIICICNDRNHLKIRSLANYCYDLRFQKPRLEQIKAAMMSVAFKEGIKVSPEALQDVIVASNQDIRQVLHNMSMWSAKAKGMSAGQTKLDVGKGTKHIKMGPFDVLREVFAIARKPTATIMDKSDLFFHDYSIAPLFVHENYIHVIPAEAEGDKQKHLTLLSEAADSICIGDIIDRQIRSNNSWSLLPAQAIFASVVPGELLQGHLRQMVNFPAWFGKNSNRNHMDRVLQELHVHMRMRVTGNKTDIALEYLPLLKHALTKPLIENEQEGVREVLKYMEEYYLLREDFDSIIDLSLWPGQTDPRSKISTKVKSAFTRTYNKECGRNPYAVTNVKKKKGSAKDSETLPDNEEDIEEEEEQEDDSIENDAMIKVKKAPKKNSSTSDASTSKEKKKAAPKKGKSK